MNGGCQPDKFDWIKFEQPWAARRAKPMDGWSNGELQEVIRNDMDACSNEADPFNYFNYTIQPKVSKQAFYPSLAVS